MKDEILMARSKFFARHLPGKEPVSAAKLMLGNCCSYIVKDSDQRMQKLVANVFITTTKTKSRNIFFPNYLKSSHGSFPPPPPSPSSLRICYSKASVTKLERKHFSPLTYLFFGLTFSNYLLREGEDIFPKLFP